MLKPLLTKSSVKASSNAALLGGLLALIPALVLRDPLRYWLVVFLLASMVDVKKTLMDGLEARANLVVIDAEGRSAGGYIREVDFVSNSRGVDPLFEGIKIVDCDTHITEAPDLFTSRAPAKYKDKVPFVKLDPDGVERWYVGDRNFGSMGGNVIRADKNKLLGRLAFPKLEQAHPGGHVRGEGRPHRVRLARGRPVRVRRA